MPLDLSNIPQRLRVDTNAPRLSRHGYVMALGTNMGAPNCSDYTMGGDSINIASRLQGKAATGEILVTDAAYKSISAAFPGAVRVEYLVKGISHPIAAHRLSRGPSATT